MRFFYITMIASCFLCSQAAMTSHKSVTQKVIPLIYKSSTRGDISCANRVIIAAEQAIDRAKIGPQQYDQKQITRAIFYTKTGSFLAKYLTQSPHYEKLQDIITQEPNITKAIEKLDKFCSEQMNKKFKNKKF